MFVPGSVERSQNRPAALVWTRKATATLYAFNYILLPEKKAKRQCVRERYIGTVRDNMCVCVRESEQEMQMQQLLRTTN